ncbi:MAG: hypothetical protein WC365_08825 [Candidatus Babeliales bacterium]|jgi:hypothetical protein
MELLKTTKCLNCGAQIETRHTSIAWEPIQVEQGFLGGKRVRFKKAVCDCGKRYLALYLTDGNNFKLSYLVEQPEPIIEQDKTEALIEPEPQKEPEKEPDSKNKAALIEQAKALGVKGVLQNMKEETLLKKIQEVTDNATAQGKE